MGTPWYVDGVRFVIFDERIGESAHVWEVAKIDKHGFVARTGPLVTFDKHKVYALFLDFPENMTAEQVAIIKDELPRWAEFFADRLK